MKALLFIKFRLMVLAWMVSEMIWQGPTAFADEGIAKTYRFGLGFAYGNISQPSSGEVSFIGVPTIFGLWVHPSLFWSAGIEGRFTPDLANPQIARKGIEGGYAYHILGGGPYYQTGGSVARITKSFPWSLSALAKAGYFSYSLSDADRTSQQISGQMITLKGGLVVRVASYELEALTTLYSIPAGTERIKELAFEIVFAYRWQT